jgi:hypothetical protein
MPCKSGVAAWAAGTINVASAKAIQILAIENPPNKQWHGSDRARAFLD